MSLLPEYAVLPEVLEAMGDASRISLRSLFELCLSEGIVRNLHKGRWRQRLAQNPSALSPAGRKVFEFLGKTGRLRSCAKGLSSPPDTSIEWCREALASQKHRDLHAIFAEKETAALFAEEPAVVATEDAMERDDLRPQNSIALRFHVDDYCQHLAPLIGFAREVDFIDPYIDPNHSHYADAFLKILDLAARSPSRPQVRVHRTNEFGQGSRKQNLDAEKGCRLRFERWHRQLEEWKIDVEVFIWTKFQSRYLLTNHVGLLAGKGFKHDPTKKEHHHWARLDRKNCDEVRRDFNPLGNSPVHELKFRFRIGGS